MASKTEFICSSCGYQAGKWYGKCPECNNWNTFEEVAVEKVGKNTVDDFTSSKNPQQISEIKSVKLDRISTGFEEFDRVLGGLSVGGEKKGIVPGSVILLSGDPGVGKSTILLQVAMNMARRTSHVADQSLKKISSTSETLQATSKVLYITGEESESQVKLRAERISGVNGENSSLYIFSITNIDKAIEQAQKGKWDLVIVDSIQTMASDSFPGFPGSVPQIRYATGKLVTFAKKNHIPVFLVGHVTKEGIVAGPMILSHMVDVVLYLEGQSLTGTRILRAFKNRFGDTSEVGIFLMQEEGLIELKDASSFFMDKNDIKVPGACLTVVMEGTRPILIEIQALVVPTSLSFPRRVATGIAEKRLELLLAVIQKHLRLPFDRLDVFVNVVGGLKITETATDLAVCLALVSSYKNKTLNQSVAIAEIGLLGELKSVLNLEKRVKEVMKLGFKKVVTVKSSRFLSEIVKEII